MVNLPPALQGGVLVLNRFYMAIQVVPVRRALAMLVLGRAEVVSVQGEQYRAFTFAQWVEHSRRAPAWSARFVRSVSFRLAVPEVLRLPDCQRVIRPQVAFTRRNVYARDRYRCQYCGVRCAPRVLTLDHVVPRTQGGGSTWENVVCACGGCNARKAGRTPAQAGMRLVAPPLRPARPPDLLRRADGNARAWRYFLGKG